MDHRDHRDVREHGYKVAQRAVCGKGRWVRKRESGARLANLRDENIESRLLKRACEKTWCQPGKEA